MPVVSTVLRLLGAGTSIYMLVCVARILMSWFPASSLGRSGELVSRVTDPYLDLWKRIRFLRAGNVDFSPIVALAALSGLSRILTVASYGALSVGVGLSLVIEVLWSPVAFLLSFFSILVAARIVAYAARWNSLHPAWRTVDAIINPVLWRIKRLVYRDRIVNYMQGLVTGAIALIGTRVTLGLLMGLLLGLLRRF